LDIRLEIIGIEAATREREPYAWTRLKDNPGKLLVVSPNEIAAIANHGFARSLSKSFF
jgi:hypothetical protein